MNSRDSGKYLLALFATCGAALLFMASMVYYVDPAKLFHTDYEKGVAKIILSGKNADNLGDFDDRSFQIAYMEKSKRKFDVIALGSSRTTYVRQKNFPGLSFHNYSLAHACISDIMSLYEEYRTETGKPKLVLIGIDPRMFTPDERSPALRNQYIAILKRLKLFDPKIDGADDGRFTKLQYLFNANCFKQSIQMFMNTIHGKKIIGNFNATDRSLPEGDGFMMYSDGSYYFNMKMTSATQEAINNQAKEYTVRLTNMLPGDVDPVEKHRFEVFLDSLGKDGVRVVIFLAPFHPITKDGMSKMKEYSGIDKLESYLNNFANERNISVVGSFDPNKSECGSNEFFDGHHPKQPCVDRILNTINLSVSQKTIPHD